MTRLYVDVYCECCDRPYSADVGTYFGRRLGDEKIVRGVCFHCRLKEAQYGQCHSDPTPPVHRLPNS